VKRSLLLAIALVPLACAPAPSMPAFDTAGMEPKVARLLSEARDEVLAYTDSAAAWGHLAQALHAHRELDAALLAYARAHAIDGKNPRWAYGQACAAQEQRLPLSELELLFAAAQSLLPDHAPLYCRLGAARMHSGESAGAVQAYTRALELDSDLTLAYRGLGHALLASGEEREAIAQLQQAVSRQPDDSIAWAALARAWRRLGDEARARAATERSVAGHPFEHIPDPLREEIALLAVNSATLLGRADAALSRGDAAAAAAQLARAAEARPDDPWSWRNLALALRRSGELERARDAARRSIELAPEFALAYLELGKIDEVRGQLGQAELSYRKVVQLEPDNGAGWTRLAATLYRLGRTQEAFEAYAEGDQQSRFGAETLADWGTAFLGAGRNAEAITAFERALSLAPGLRRAVQGCAQARNLQDNR